MCVHELPLSRAAPHPSLRRLVPVFQSGKRQDHVRRHSPQPAERLGGRTGEGRILFDTALTATPQHQLQVQVMITEVLSLARAAPTSSGSFRGPPEALLELYGYNFTQSKCSNARLGIAHG